MKSLKQRLAIPIILVVTVIVVLWVTGMILRAAGSTTGAEGSETTTPAITFAPGQTGSASYVSGFDNLGELCNSADVIVIGTVDRVIEVVPSKYDIPLLYDASSAFRVEEVLKGEIENEIIFTKWALKGENVWVEDMAEDPPFAAGERWVLFLSAELSYNNLGPWGRYKIIGDRVYSMNRITGDNNAYGADRTDFNLDFNGVALSEFIADINQTLDSIVLTFTYGNINWAISPAVRFEAGGFQNININLATGKYGPEELTYTVTRVAEKDSAVGMPVPDEMQISLEPSVFTAYPHSQYRSILSIRTSPCLSPGTYWIRVDYQYGGSMSGYGVLMVNINSPEPSGTW